MLIEHTWLTVRRALRATADTAGDADGPHPRPGDGGRRAAQRPRIALRQRAARAGGRSLITHITRLIMHLHAGGGARLQSARPPPAGLLPMRMLAAARRAAALVAAAHSHRSNGGRAPHAPYLAAAARARSRTSAAVGRSAALICSMRSIRSAISGDAPFIGSKLRAMMRLPSM